MKTYAVFFGPAALVVAILTLMLTPLLSLVAFMIALPAIAAGVVAFAVEIVAATFRLATSNSRHARAETAGTQLKAGQPADGAVPADSERSISCL